MDPYMSYYGYQEPRSNVQERSAGQRYNGLRNQGATCYLNSVLQCLYMTEDFRKEVENFVPIQINSDEERLVQELQKLFVNMKECVCSTEGITRCLGITNVYKEEDVVEYYQKILKAIGPQLSKVFEGKMSNKTKCLNDHIFEEKCHFFTIPLAIKAEHSEVFNVLNGLNTFSEPVKLDEDNWLYCKDCGQKNETQTWNEIEEFPTILTLYPKRFYFDYNQMRPVKNHCPMDFPLHLLIRNNEYELYAVINHIGSEYGGHYNAVIKSFEDDKWYCFDDSVSIVLRDPSNFKGSISSMKAYLLMYRMKYSEKGCGGQTQQCKKMSSAESGGITTSSSKQRHRETSVKKRGRVASSAKQVKCSQKEKRRMRKIKELLTTVIKSFEDSNCHCSDDTKGAKSSFQISQKWQDDLTSSGERGQKATSSGDRGQRATSSGDRGQRATSSGERGQRATSLGARGRTATSSTERGSRTSHSGEREHRTSQSGEREHKATSSVERGRRATSLCERGRRTSHSGEREHKATPSGERGHRATSSGKQGRRATSSTERGHRTSHSGERGRRTSHSGEREHKATSSGERGRRATSSVERGRRATSSDERRCEATSSGEGEHKATSVGERGFSATSSSKRRHRASHLDEQGHTWTSSDKQGCGAASSAECSQTRQDGVTSSIDALCKVVSSEDLWRGAASSADQGGFGRLDATEEIDGQHPSVKSTYVMTRDPEEGKKSMNTVQEAGDKLLEVDHPAQSTIESQEHYRALENLKQDSHTFMSRSQESDIFSAEKHKQSESTYNNATQYYNNLPQTVEQEEMDGQHPSVKSTYSQEHHKALENLKQDSHTFMSRSQESDIFSAEEYKQSESTYNNATQYYNNLPQTVEQGEQNESVSNSYVTHIMRLRQRLERVGSHIIIRCCSQPVDTDPPKAFAQETTEQKNIQAVLEDIKKDLDKVVKQSEAALTCSQQSTWARILRSEIDITMKMLDHVDSLFSIYMDKVKSIDLGIHRTDGTGDVLRKFGNQLYYFHEVPANEKEVESNKAQLKT